MLYLDYTTTDGHFVEKSCQRDKNYSDAFVSKKYVT